MDTSVILVIRIIGEINESPNIARSLFGIMGMLLTVPITSVILVLLDERVKDYEIDR